MPRLATLLLLLVLPALASAAPVPKAKVKDEEAMLGKWKLVELIKDGKPTGRDLRGDVATIDGKIIAVNRGDGNGGEAGAYDLDSTRKHFDLGPPGPSLDAPQKGRYELDGDTLVIALRMGQGGERPADVKSGPGVAYLKLRRVVEEQK